ncbi:MAG: alpha-glucan family phosphorylase [Chloroflexota bacterium]
MYSGGLGVLAGDHCKAASDASPPFVAVGLFYRRYFHQTIDADSHQEHAYPDLDGVAPAAASRRGQDSDPLVVPVELPGRTVQVAVWLVGVVVCAAAAGYGRPSTTRTTKPITHILYVRGRGDAPPSGVGAGRGRRARPAGARHPAGGMAPQRGPLRVQLVERARELVAEGDSLQAALARVRDRSVFTIHTPVSAGNERFDADLVRRIASPFLEPSGVDIERILEVGRGPDDDPSQFDMTGFSLRTSHASNAVSQLHAQTANATWNGIVSQPILGITNGVHPGTWLGGPIRTLYGLVGAELDKQDDERPKDRFWDRLQRVSDERLWDAHLEQKLELALFARGSPTVPVGASR